MRSPPIHMLNLLEPPVPLFPYVMSTRYEDTPLWLWWMMIPPCHINWLIPDRWPLHPASFPASLSYSTTATTSVDASEAVQTPSKYHCHPPPPYWWCSYPGSETSPSLAILCSATFHHHQCQQGCADTQSVLLLSTSPMPHWCSHPGRVLRHITFHYHQCQWGFADTQLSTPNICFHHTSWCSHPGWTCTHLHYFWRWPWLLDSPLTDIFFSIVFLLSLRYARWLSVCT